MQEPSVSIIVPTFNRSGYLKECLDSLLAQTVKAHEILVVDDGSEDDTPAVIASFGDRVRHIRKPNGGKPRAVNLALQSCTGDWVWLFDDDDVALPQAIENRLRVAAQHPGCGFVYSAHKLGSDGPDGKIAPGRLCLPAHPGEQQLLLELVRSCFFHLNSTLVRRDLYLAAGPFDPALKAGEDYDMQIRLARLGTAAFCPEPSFIFRQHAGVRGDKNQQYKAAARSQVFRRFSAVLGRKVRSTLDPGDYLVPRTAGPVAPTQQRLWLTHRVQAMANFGCIPELFADLHLLLQTPPSSAVLQAEELRAVSQAMCTGWASDAAEDDWPGFLAEARAIAGVQGGTPVVRALARGLWRTAKSYPGTWPQRMRRAGRALELALAGQGRKV